MPEKQTKLRDVLDDPTVANEQEKLVTLQAEQTAALSRRSELDGLLSSCDADLDEIAKASPIQQQVVADSKTAAGQQVVDAAKPAYAKLLAESCQLLRDFVESQRAMEEFRNDLFRQSTLNGLPVIRFLGWDVVTDRMPDEVRKYFRDIEIRGFTTTTSKNGS